MKIYHVAILAVLLVAAYVVGAKYPSMLSNIMPNGMAGGS